MASSNNMANVILDEGFLLDLDNQVIQAHKKDQERINNSKYLYLFYMPAEADKRDATRMKTIRFLTPLGGGTKILEHGSWQKFRTVCPKFYGQDCQYCKMTDEQKQKQKVVSEWWYMWTVWDYAAREEKGDVRLFAYKVNNASPVPKINKMMHLEQERAVKEKRPALELCDFDIELIQFGEGSKRTFTTAPLPPRPFDVANNTVTKDISKKAMRDSYTYNLKESRHLLGIIDDEEDEVVIDNSPVVDSDADEISRILNQQ